MPFRETPPYSVVKTINTRGDTRTFRFWDPNDAFCRFEKYRNDPAVISANLYDNTFDPPLLLNSFLHLI